MRRAKDHRTIASHAMLDAMPCHFRRLQDVSNLSPESVLGFLWMLEDWGVLVRSRTNNEIREEWAIEMFDLTPVARAQRTKHLSASR